MTMVISKITINTNKANISISTPGVYLESLEQEDGKNWCRSILKIEMVFS